MLRSAPLAAIFVPLLVVAASQTFAFQHVSAPRAAPINTALSAQPQEGSNSLVDDTVSLGVRGLTAAFGLFALATLSGPGPAGAVSGGGLDYGTYDRVNQSFHDNVSSIFISRCLHFHYFLITTTANLDITGQDFSHEGKLYKGKDFSVRMKEWISSCMMTFHVSLFTILAFILLSQ